jgi:hypothetical protein
MWVFVEVKFKVEQLEGIGRSSTESAKEICRKGRFVTTVDCGRGVIFGVNERGYYLLLLQRGKGASDTARSGHPIAYMLAKRLWSEALMKPITGWIPFRISPAQTTIKPGPASPFVTAFVKRTGNRVAVRIDGIEAISLTDDTFADGQAGVGYFGAGHALFRNLEVHGVE